jgi:hypothetical protein
MSQSSMTRIDVRGDAILVASLAERENGWQMQPDIRRLTRDTGASELGAEVEAALLRSAAGEGEGEDGFEALLRSAGVKSWSQYVKGLDSVRVRRNGDTVKVVPQRNRGARQGLEDISEAVETLQKPDAATLGQAVQRALARIGEGSE